MRRLIPVLILINSALIACGGTPTPDLKATVQGAIAATQAAQQTETPMPTPSPTPITPYEDYPSLRIHADELSIAIVHNDFDKLIDLTYPKVVDMVGGRAEMTAVLEQFVEEEGVTFLSVSIDEPEEIVSIKNRLFAIVPTTIEFKVEGRILVGKSFQIGISEDDGKTWTFIDGSAVGSNRQVFKTLFSSTLDELELPDIGPPKFYPE